MGERTDGGKEKTEQRNRKRGEQKYDAWAEEQKLENRKQEVGYEGQKEWETEIEKERAILVMMLLPWRRCLSQTTPQVPCGYFLRTSLIGRGHRNRAPLTGWKGESERSSRRVPFYFFLVVLINPSIIMILITLHLHSVFYSKSKRPFCFQQIH